MRHKSYDAACEQATVLQEKLSELAKSNEIRRHERLWNEFLGELTIGFNRLAHGAESGKSSPWAGRIKSDRRKDPLLSYLKNARDARNHGIERVATLSGRAVTLEPHDPHPMILGFTFVTDAGETIEVATDRREDWLKVVDESLKLVEVVNEGRTYPPPTEHMGAPIVDPSPLKIGTLALTYFKQKLDEAKQFLD